MTRGALRQTLQAVFVSSLSPLTGGGGLSLPLSDRGAGVEDSRPNGKASMEWQHRGIHGLSRE